MSTTAATASLSLVPSQEEAMLREAVAGICDGFGREYMQRKRDAGAAQPRQRDDVSNAAHSPNTNSIDAVEVFLSSGMVARMTAGCLDPTSTATYCLPLTE